MLEAAFCCSTYLGRNTVLAGALENKSEKRLYVIHRVQYNQSSARINHVCMYVCISVSIQVRTYVCNVYTYMYMYIMYVRMYISYQLIMKLIAVNELIRF